MKTQKFWMTALLLSGAFYANAQLVQDNFETGAGLLNGAFNNSFSSTRGAAFFGYRAGFNTTTKDIHGDNNTFIGHDSGFSNLAGHDNTFSGWSSGFNSNTGNFNTFVGSQSGGNNTSGSQNSFFGAFSGNTNGSASNNTIMGFNSGFNNTADNNSFFGSHAGLANSTGAGNVFMGSSAGYSNTIGYNNVFLGLASGYRNTEGVSNIFIGTHAGYNNQIGANNISIGLNAGRLNNSYFNTFIGFGAGENNTGSSNVFVGNTAGQNNTGAGNVFIGNAAGYANVSGNHELYIENSDINTPLIYGDFYNNKLVFNGKVGITNETLANQANLFPTTAGSVNVSAYQLFVKGGILTEEVRVNLKANWADYVFENDYNLRPLAEVEQYIAKNGHLPNVPSAKQVKEDGIELGDMSRIQQEKIEELTLYAIAQDKQIDNQNKKLEQQQKEIDELKAAVKSLMSQK